MGGIFVEVFRDYSIRICPISPKDAKEMVTEIKSYKLLEGYRGKAGVNIKAVEKELLKVSKMLMKERRIKELDFNPLMATEQGIVAVDARVVV
jgi:acyl-CoA synthetase (NDP forming)